MYLDQNLKLIAARWPKLAERILKTADPEQIEVIIDAPERTLMVNGIHLSSCYDRRREARIQAELAPEASAQATVYGLLTGDLPRVLLARPQLKQLTVVLMNLSVERAALTYLEHADWLADPRVTLTSADREGEIRFPFACASACLYLADEESARLRDLLQLELATPYIQTLHKQRAVRYQDRIIENESFVRQDNDVEELFGRFVGQTMVVAAAGPTLADQLPWLVERRNKIQLIAVDIAVRSLMCSGIVPDYVVAIDSSTTLFEKAFEGLELKKLIHSSLVYFPLVDPNILMNWSGKRFTAYSRDDIFRDACSRFPRGKLFSSGSVIHPAVDLAVKMGGSKVVLCGADFSFTKNQSHVHGAREKVELDSARDWLFNNRGERVATTPNLRGYLRDLERYINRHTGVEFFNTSMDGAKIAGAQTWPGDL